MTEPEGGRRPNRMQHMDRKSVPLWPDQVDALIALTLALRRHGRGKGSDAITLATLIRTAIDYYLAHCADALGVDENDLRAAVGLPARRPDGTLVLQDAPSKQAREDSPAASTRTARTPTGPDRAPRSPKKRRRGAEPPDEEWT